MSRQLEVKNLTIAYDGKTAVEGVSFYLGAADIGCLLGPSGCGKTSLLRAIAGFEPVVAGEILLRGRQVTRPGESLEPEQRHVGMVFQDFALYPHLTVWKNVAFGIRRFKRAERRRRVDELLKLVNMQGTENKYPHQLSGGQQQRIALVRAMAPRPDILLLDEPFSGLDVELRTQLAREVRDILKRDQITAILVTHDQLEAFAMADKIAVMAEGELRQWGDGYQLYHRPVDRFVADFIGQGAMLPGQIIDGPRIETPLGIVQGNHMADLSPGETVDLLLRPSDIVHDDDSPFKLEVLDRVFQGAEYLYTLHLSDDTKVLCLVQSHHDHAIGERIGVKLDVSSLVIFASDH
ncbi:MAG: ABC transporter ATP-binding protein [Gammaproteobacteria bacterium]|nr:ABC transporter ATP-binding protein [Gammaproteobacteria bacterium]